MGETEIANRFAEVFEAVCVPNSKDKNEQMRSFLTYGFRVIGVQVRLLDSLLLL